MQRRKEQTGDDHDEAAEPDDDTIDLGLQLRFDEL
jgi:hypothetical protein